MSKVHMWYMQGTNQNKMWKVLKYISKQIANGQNIRRAKTCIFHKLYGAILIIFKEINWFSKRHEV